MALVNQLKELLAKEQDTAPYRGSVVKVQDGKIYTMVAGQVQAVDTPQGDATVYKEGDTISIRAGIALGRVNVGSTKVVYV